MPESLTYGVPDIQLPGPSGQVNPSDFAGHDLIVLFCPADKDDAARELADYNGLTHQLAFNDAYMVAVCDKDAGSPASRISTANTASRAWAAFSRCLSPHERSAPEDGAVFLFGRGGCLRKAWRGSGHAKEVIRSLGERM